MLLDFRKPSCIIEEKCVSATGKYMGFIGTHYHKNKPCWVVGVSNKTNGEIIMRHYNDETCVNDEAARFAAHNYWEATFKPGLLKPSEDSLEHEGERHLERWLEEFDAKRATSGRKYIN